MLTITKRIEWDMAHRLVHGYTSKCAHLHGHRYVAELTFAAPQLDRHSMVIDFAEVTRLCKGWIDAHLDHGTLVCHDDASLVEFLTAEKQKHYLVSFNTTVERMTPWLVGCLQAQLPAGVTLVGARVWETPTGSAVWQQD